MKEEALLLLLLLGASRVQPPRPTTVTTIDEYIKKEEKEEEEQPSTQYPIPPEILKKKLTGEEQEEQPSQPPSTPPTKPKEKVGRWEGTVTVSKFNDFGTGLEVCRSDLGLVVHGEFAIQPCYNPSTNTYKIVMVNYSSRELQVTINGKTYDLGAYDERSVIVQPGTYHVVVKEV